MPYFYGNTHLQFLLEDLKKNNEPASVKLFEKITSNELFNDTTKDAASYVEDEWTERLQFCLQLNNISSELTAYLRGPNVKKSWEKKLPKDVYAKSLLFHGAPDIIIHKKKDARKEGMLVVYCEKDEEADSSPDSQDSGRLQIGHLLTNVSTYTYNSFLSDKVGELVAALHTSLACRALRRYMRRKKFNSLTAHGLHIHRTVGIIHIEVVLSKHTMASTATQLVGGVLSAANLCAVMKY